MSILEMLVGRARRMAAGIPGNPNAPELSLRGDLGMPPFRCASQGRMPSKPLTPMMKRRAELDRAVRRMDSGRMEWPENYSKIELDAILAQRSGQ